MKKYLSKKKRPFRLSAIINGQYGWECVVKWLDTNQFETFALSTVEPYLI